MNIQSINVGSQSLEIFALGLSLFFSFIAIFRWFYSQLEDYDYELTRTLSPLSRIKISFKITYSAKDIYRTLSLCFGIYFLFGSLLNFYYLEIKPYLDQYTEITEYFDLIVLFNLLCSFFFLIIFALISERILRQFIQDALEKSETNLSELDP